MAILKVDGGHRLSGDIRPMGARNEALQVICATLLSLINVSIPLAHVSPVLTRTNK